MPDQFGSFDGLDNRKTILALFKRMGRGLPERVAGKMRAGFLQGLLAVSTNGFDQAPVFVDPCDAVEAYFLMTSLCTALGVDIERAADLLEEVVAHGERQMQERRQEMILATP